MKKILSLTVISIIVVTSLTYCDHKHEEHSTNANNDYLLFATLYQQLAAEKDALSHQAFNTAKLMLNDALRSARLTKKLAVVVDIDETVLDNSPFEAKSILENSDYPTYWKEWCEQASAIPIAGSLEFLQYAESVGVDVFYITNRKEEYRESTLRNLVSLGYPNADNEHLLMKTTTSNKEPRRMEVEKTHHIVLLVGDNLGDFLHDFDDVDNATRNRLVDSLKHEFGSRFIVLPNAMYGSWANNLFEKDNTKEEKIIRMKESLKSF